MFAKLKQSILFSKRRNSGSIRFKSRLHPTRIPVGLDTNAGSIRNKYEWSNFSQLIPGK
ncbi:MAG: hypothetical protein LUH22_14420 [Bacteroides sp.]|nr:hypothetical protein [Bacteroides sp.]